MSRLSPDSLPDDTDVYDYDRTAVTAGILHFGIGNFHRAHQAVYCDDLLNAGETRWGITGVSLRSENVRDALAPQGHLYTLAVLGETTHYRVVGSVLDILVAPEDPQRVFGAIADPATQVVSSTITEKGYCLGPDGVDFDHPDLRAELKSLDKPTTLYGYLARGIIDRANQSGGPLTIMCCDNISAGGEFTRDGVEALLQRHSETALAWSRHSVTFISTMVDRVCPATTDNLRDTVERDTGHRDEWPVSAEPFSQWIIEDNFAGDRPPYDKAGAVFIDDIAPFERMKLRYLNAAHTIISTLGYLYGDSYVHEALQRPEVERFTCQALVKDVLPNAPVPHGYSGERYIADVLSRFRNANLPYGNLQVGTDSSQKIQQRWFPTVDRALDAGKDASYLAFCLGAWTVFIQKATAEGVLNDPKLSAFKTLDMNSTIEAYLDIANAKQFAFHAKPDFMASVIRHTDALKAQGLDGALREFLKA